MPARAPISSEYSISSPLSSGTSSATLALCLVLVVVGNIYSIGFFKDIALALLLLSIVGTVGFSVVLKRGD